eukprot:361538-Chlamydomonas_euryale.AAC.1
MRNNAKHGRKDGAKEVSFPPSPPTHTLKRSRACRKRPRTSLPLGTPLVSAPSCCPRWALAPPKAPRAGWEPRSRCVAGGRRDGGRRLNSNLRLGVAEDRAHAPCPRTMLMSCAHRLSSWTVPTD